MPEPIAPSLALLVRFKHLAETHSAQSEAIAELAKLLGISTTKPMRFVEPQSQEDNNP